MHVQLERSVMKGLISALHAHVALSVPILRILHRDVWLGRGVQEERLLPVSSVRPDFSVQVQVHLQMCVHQGLTLQPEIQLASPVQPARLVRIQPTHQLLVQMENIAQKGRLHVTFVLLAITAVSQARQSVFVVKATIR